MRPGRETIVASALIGVCVADPSAAYCLEYGMNTLSGTLVRQTYPGRPDFESVTRGDEPVIIWVLVLDYSVCVVEGGYKSPREDYEREVQVVLKEAEYALYRGLLGKRVDVIGTLRHGYADYKPLLIEPVEIVRARRR